MAADDVGTEVAAALALLHAHLALAQALVDVLVRLETPPEQVAWARAELDQLQATDRDIATRYRPKRIA